MKSTLVPVVLGAAILLGWAQPSHATDDAVGLWQLNHPDGGESKLYITETAGKLHAEEFGLGFAKGKTVTCADGQLVAHFEVGKDLAGSWELHLNAEHTKGKGKIVFTHYKKDFGLGAEQQLGGRKVRVVKGLSAERLSRGGFGDDWTIEYIPSHRATFTQQWKYTFPDYRSTRWIIALRYAPEVPWSRDSQSSAELLTSDGWKPFQQTQEESVGKRRMLRIDHPHDDPKLKSGFTVRTTVTATICEQKLKKGKPTTPVAPLSSTEKKFYLRETEVYDFHQPDVKKWMDDHKMWRKEHEGRMTFALRIRRELIDHLPYDMKEARPWTCSHILEVGWGECCRHAMVATSILRANKIPARTMCALWAIDDKSEGGHCWMEVFLDGVGWVTCDSTGMCVGDKPAAHLAGMIDFDWVIDAGSAGKQTVAGIDAWPAFWGQGKGSMKKSDLDVSGKVHILKRLRQ